MTPRPITWEDAQATWASETGGHFEVGQQPASHNWTSLTGKPAAGPSCLLRKMAGASVPRGPQHQDSGTDSSKYSRILLPDGPKESF